MLFIKDSVRDLHLIINCPECGKRGFLSKKWVRSGYYPSYKSELCRELESIKDKLTQDPENKGLATNLKLLQERITGVRYNKFIKKEKLDNLVHYKVRSIKYYHYYVGTLRSRKI